VHKTRRRGCRQEKLQAPQNNDQGRRNKDGSREFMLTLAVNDLAHNRRTQPLFAVSFSDISFARSNGQTPERSGARAVIVDMDNQIEPIVGNWYQNLANGQLFQVVAYDETEALVELQHFDGDLEEATLSSWRRMDVEAAAAPEDWTGPMDNIERDDLGDDPPATKDTARHEIAQESQGALAESYGDSDETVSDDGPVKRERDLRQRR
jgi:hypothetical protein